MFVGILDNDKIKRKTKTEQTHTHTHTTKQKDRKQKQISNKPNTTNKTNKQTNKQNKNADLEGVTVLLHKRYWDCASEFVHGQDLPKQVSLAKLQYTNRGGDRFDVTAVDDSVTEKHVHLSVGCGAGADDGGSDN